MNSPVEPATPPPPPQLEQQLRTLYDMLTHTQEELKAIKKEAKEKQEELSAEVEAVREDAAQDQLLEMPTRQALANEAKFLIRLSRILRNPEATFDEVSLQVFARHQLLLAKDSWSEGTCEAIDNALQATPFKSATEVVQRVAKIKAKGSKRNDNFRRGGFRGGRGRGRGGRGRGSWNNNNHTERQ